MGLPAPPDEDRGAEIVAHLVIQRECYLSCSPARSIRSIKQIKVSCKILLEKKYNKLFDKHIMKTVIHEVGVFKTRAE